MITNIHVEHYKAFETADVPIKPFTVFLGENSAGKSSIFQLLLLIQQTAERIGSYDSALVINGSSTQRGSVDYLFHNFDSSKPIRIGITFRSSRLLCELQKLADSFVDDLQSISNYVPIRGLQDWRSKSFKHDDIHQRILEFSKIINREAVSDEKDKLKKNIIALNQFISAHELDRGLSSKIIGVFELLRWIKNTMKSPEFTLTFDILKY